MGAPAQVRLLRGAAFVVERTAIEAAENTLVPAMERIADDAKWRRVKPDLIASMLRDQVLLSLDDMDAQLARSRPTDTSPSRQLWEAWSRYVGLRRAAAAALGHEATSAKGWPAKPPAFREFDKLQDQARVAKREVNTAAEKAWSE